MKYVVMIERTARKALGQIDSAQRRRIEIKIEGLGDEPRPHGVTKLTGVDAYRVRVGAYRVVYTVDDAVLVVSVTNVGHRRSIYREV